MRGASCACVWQVVAPRAAFTSRSITDLVQLVLGAMLDTISASMGVDSDNDGVDMVPPLDQDEDRPAYESESDDKHNVNDDDGNVGIFNDRMPPRRRIALPLLTMVALILIIVGISYGRTKTMAAPATTLSTSLGEGSIIEFTMANLNTNREKCTYIQPASRLECVPNHDHSTNKFRIQLHPDWSPIGVKRFEELTRADFWQEVRIFRIVPGFVSQFGISSDPSTQQEWSKQITDDPVVGSNVRGTVTFATSGKNTRTTQIFINTSDNQFLDTQGFSPIGQVLKAGEGYGGMEIVDEFYDGYGEKPDQGKIRTIGMDYLQEFPLLSFVVSAEFVA